MMSCGNINSSVL